MISAFFTAILSFISTNIDDIFILMILYTQARDSKGIRRIISGQYFGIAVLTALSILGALGTQLFPPRYIGLLGLLPLFLGIRSWFTYKNSREEPEHNPKENDQISFLSVSMLTIANGADNIGIYIPVFSSYSVPEFAITLIVFAGMLALWCYLGLTLADHPYIKDKITRYQHVLVPLVLIGLGVSILAKNFL